MFKKIKIKKNKKQLIIKSRSNKKLMINKSEIKLAKATKTLIEIVKNFSLDAIDVNHHKRDPELK